MKFETSIQNKRRKLLLGTFATSGIVSHPQAWITPIVNGIMLPAHAQTSVAMCSLMLSNVTVSPDNGSIDINDQILVQGDFDISNFQGLQATLSVDFSSEGNEGGSIIGEEFALNAGGLGRFSVAGALVAPNPFSMTTIFTSISFRIVFSGTSDDGATCNVEENLIIPIDLVLEP